MNAKRTTGAMDSFFEPTRKTAAIFIAIPNCLAV